MNLARRPRPHSNQARYTRALHIASLVRYGPLSERFSWRRGHRTLCKQSGWLGGQNLFVDAGKETLKDKEPLLIGCHSAAASVRPE